MGNQESQVGLQENNLEVVVPSNANNGVGIAAQAVPLKRKRGRPRKHPVVPFAQPVSATVAEAQNGGSNASDAVK